jgi:hypothetical protein
MRQGFMLAHSFVEFIPDVLEDRMLYVSMKFAVVAHKCCCGCGNEVVTPLSPTDWKLLFDGKTISLTPSIGNWGFDCQSHYWIRGSRVSWVPRWSQDRIEAGRFQDRLAKSEYYGMTADTADLKKGNKDKIRRGLWRRFKSWWS